MAQRQADAQRMKQECVLSFSVRTAQSLASQHQPVLAGPSERASNLCRLHSLSFHFLILVIFLVFIPISSGLPAELLLHLGDQHLETDE